MLESITHKTFKEGSIFRITDMDGFSLELILAKIVLSPYKIFNSTREPFSLIFTGPKEFHASQGTYIFETAGFEPFEMFMTPIVPPGGDQRFYYYQAIFS